MLFGTLVDRVPGIREFQVVQTAPTALRVRLQPADRADLDHVWQVVRAGITDLLTGHRVSGI
jgi:hypothetical protein